MLLKDEKNLAFQESFSIMILYKAEGRLIVEVLRIERNESDGDKKD